MLLLKILQYLQKDTCVGVYAPLLKIYTNTGVLLYILQDFKEHLFWRTKNIYIYTYTYVCNANKNKFDLTNTKINL